MDTALPIVIQNLSKSFGLVAAVNDLSFTVEPGRVTGFLGPNGSGKTTTLRMLLGLTRPDHGTATFGATPYARLSSPLTVVGASLDATSFHPGRTGRDHLRTQAPLAGANDSRIDELLAFVGLSDAAQQRVNGYSLGMRQRLSLATALLGDPQYLILDEPANGLDPQGIRWLRDFLRHLAHQGKTVLVSSHILSEVQQTVDEVVIISQGNLRFADSMATLREMSEPMTRILTPQPEALTALARSEGWECTLETNAPDKAGRFLVRGATTAQIGSQLFSARIEVHELSDVTESLEDSFLRLTAPIPSDMSTQTRHADTQGPDSQSGLVQPGDNA